MDRLDERLEEFADSHPVSFHMPGHKGRDLGLGSMEQYDITEIDGFDELYEASGILKSLQEELTGLYQSRRSYLLTNGSTGGNLAAIYAACRAGDTILVDRACHRSVHHAIEIRNLRPVDIAGQPLHAVRAEEVSRALAQTPEAKALVITSPTYEGMIADLEAIAGICHSHGVILIVDAAHGAHFLRGTVWEQYGRALRSADLVIMSLHKTLPVLGQTACLHVYSDRVSLDEVSHSIEIFHTSSPSYLLMAAAAKCIGQLADPKERGMRFTAYRKRLDAFYGRMRSLKHIGIWRQEDHPDQPHDPGKLILTTTKSPLGGMDLLRALEDREIWLEMAGYDYALAMTSIADENEDFDRLFEALAWIDGELEEGRGENLKKGSRGTASIDADLILPQAGSPAYDMISIYPPGTPIVCRGERIEERHLAEIRRALQAGLYVRGLRRK